MYVCVCVCVCTVCVCVFLSQIWLALKDGLTGMKCLEGVREAKLVSRHDVIVSVHVTC